MKQTAETEQVEVLEEVGRQVRAVSQGTPRDLEGGAANVCGGVYDDPLAFVIGGRDRSATQSSRPGPSVEPCASHLVISLAYSLSGECIRVIEPLRQFGIDALATVFDVKRS